MFRPTAVEWELMGSEILTSRSIGFEITNCDLKTNAPGMTQMVSLKGSGGSRYLPYAFTEQGIAMLSGVLNSERAINMNISIMRAFVETRRLAFQDTDLRNQLKEIKETLGVHDSQLNQIYDAMENLLDEKAAQRKWNDRERIGFKK